LCGACNMHGWERNAYSFGQKTWQDLGTNRRRKLKLILGISGVRVWTGFTWLETGTDGGLLWIW
jgi:hypothetical protein